LKHLLNSRHKHLSATTGDIQTSLEKVQLLLLLSNLELLVTMNAVDGRNSCSIWPFNQTKWSL